MPSEFIHLHTHSHYSLLESTIKVSDLIKKAKEFEMPTIAMTDLGNMFGTVDFYMAAKAAGIKPIIGAEIFYTTGSRHNKQAAVKYSKRVLSANSGSEDETRLFHLVLLCKNLTGYQNLCEIVTKAYSEGFHVKPRADRELIEQYKEGLIALTGGLKGETAFHYAMKRPDRAEAAVDWLHSTFKGDLYLEVQENGLPEQSQANRHILEISEKRGIPLVATSEAHYLIPEQGIAHEVLMCIAAGRNLDENKAVRVSGDEFWLKDPNTMKSQFEWAPQAVSNTLLVADKCNFSFKLKDDSGRQIYHLPDYKSDSKEDKSTQLSVEDSLRAQSISGLESRFLEPQFEKLRKDPLFEEKKFTYQNRLKEELDMIIKTGFSGYFLVVSDFIRFAKSKNIPVGPGRGSGAGSLVAYALKITDVDPIPFNLLFERFINPERVSLPDFDVDFCQERRQEVIDYVVQKYGRDKVSQIITFGKLLARGVIRDVGRVMNLTYSEVDMIAKLVPEELGITLDQAFEKEPKLLELTKKDLKVSRLFEIAKSLEGLNRHASVHAAGIVITNKPLVEHCPLYSGKEGESVAQYDKDFAEKIGLVKFDFLGLKTLTVIANAIKFIDESLPIDQKFNLDRIDYSDPNVFKLISAGDTDGIFQLESSGMKDLCQRVIPGNLEDITAINALYRPGPLNSGMVDDFINRKHGSTPVVYDLPQLAEILEETYGVIVYQEQVMRVARVLAGYSLGEADILRRAMGKKKPEEMAKQRSKFVEGCKNNQAGSISAEQSNKIFDLLAKFAEYGFNKSHSAAYGVISYQTAYLKTYYTAQFMAALMATEMDNTDKMSQYISDAKAHQIEILPPDVNQSQKTFSVVDTQNKKKAIRFGLEAIKGVGGVAVDVILQERKEHGLFLGFLDFCKRVPQRKVNKKVIECLISTGAFDSIAEENRATLFENIEIAMEHASRHQAEADLGQVSIFENYKAEEIKLESQVTAAFKRAPDWPETKKLKLEKELVGFYVSGHPLEKLSKESGWNSIKHFVHGDLEWIKEEFERRKAQNNEKKSSQTKADANSQPWRRDDASKWEVVTIAMVSSFREIVTKKGSKMAFVEFEDAKTKIEAVCFPEAYETCQVRLKQSMEDCLPYIVTATVEIEEELPKLFLRSMELMTEYQKKRIQSVVIQLNSNEVNTEKLAQLRGLLVKHRGRYVTFLEYTGEHLGTRFMSRYQLPKELYVTASAEMVTEVNSAFRKDVVKLV